MTLIEDLKAAVRDGNVLVVVGAGISQAATNGSDIAGWRGLLRNGAQRCREIDSSLDARWLVRLEEEIDSDLDDMLSAAEKVSRKLGAPNGGEYVRWLFETVGNLKVVDRAPLEALRDLGLPIATTNYDDLIEEVAGLRPITWQQHPLALRFLRGSEPDRVMHLHGHWETPASIVLGIRSYEAVLRDEHAQAVLQALRMTRTMLFVGHGEGLRDPNFGALLDWARRNLGGDTYRHFRLAREDQVAALQAQHPAAERIFVISYGKTYADLVPFLRSLGAVAAPTAGGRAGASSPTTPNAVPASAAIAHEGQELREIESLLRDVNDRAKSLAEAAARALGVVRRLGKTTLAEFLTLELGGYPKAGFLDKRDPTYPGHRVMQSYFTIDRKINPQFFGWKTADDIFAFMEQDENFFPLGAIFSDPLAALEDRIERERRHDVLRGFLTWQSPVGALLPPEALGKLLPTTPAFCYARADAHARVLSATRSEIVRRLLALLPVPSPAERTGSTQEAWTQVKGQLVRLSPLYGMVGAPEPDDQFRVEDVTQSEVRFQKQSNQQFIAIPVHALSDPWDISSPIKRASIREGRLEFDTQSQRWSWLPR